MAGRFGKVALGAAVVAAGVAAIRSLRGGPAPAFSDHPSVLGDEPQATPTPVAAVPTPEPAAEPAPAAQATADGAWVEPVEGGCPDGYPIKAKLSSGIFHAPGGLAYERTKPDRCYRSADDAVADGLRAAKR